MKHEKETWTWELRLVLTYVSIIVIGCVLAGIIGGKCLWENEIVNMKEQLPFIPLYLAWLVAIPVGGILLRRYCFCWSKQAKQFDREKRGHQKRMKKYFEA